ncbi:MAG TPA: hypothetical protein VNL13_01400 [Sulfolobales archaeon]|nr:hypothetical protein [Sulfolobales archaeon]
MEELRGSVICDAKMGRDVLPKVKTSPQYHEYSIFRRTKRCGSMRKYREYISRRIA